MQNVIIIGAGCAGLAAAIYCARADLNPLIFSGDLENKGGLLTKTSVVENYPGFPDGVLGFDLIMNMEQQCKKFNCKIIENFIIEIIKNEDSFTLKDSKGDIYYTKTIILAMGSEPNKLKLENEDKLWGKGISSCAVCDGALYKKKKIVVVGGGDSACESALFLTKFSEVVLLLRKNNFRASNIMQKRVINNPKIKVLYNVEISKLIGEEQLNKIILNDGTNMDVDGLFYGLGLTPNSKLVENLIELENGYIKQFSGTKTSIKGIFSAGDISDYIYRQAVIACGDGCKAALDVIEYLNNL